MELIPEGVHFKKNMDEVVVPYLEARKNEHWLEWEKGRKLYCVSYEAGEGGRKPCSDSCDDGPAGQKPCSASCNGKEAAGTVLISHGFTETAEKYQECCYYFLKAGYHVYCIDHCGHGRSYRLTEDPSLVHTDGFERYVKDLIFAAEFAKKKHQGLPLFLYAHSMGGGVGAAAAAARPGLFEKIILTSPMIRPATGPVPWPLARTIARVSCALGKNMHYVAGQKSYSGPERFEESAAASRDRFDYYQEKRSCEPLYQMSAASYGWLKSAACLNGYLCRRGWRRITAPVLLFQAEEENFVSKSEQERFVRKLSRSGKARLVKVPESKHEIYCSGDRVLRRYWEEIFAFLAI